MLAIYQHLDIKFYKTINQKQKSQMLIIPLVIISLFIVSIVCQQQVLESSTKQTLLKAIEYKYLIFTSECYQQFFINSNWLSFPCLKQTAIKLLGYGLVMGGAIIKLPQIIKIIQRKNVQGISFVAVVLQISTNILATGYCIYKANPFSLYGENVFIGAQMLLVIALFVVFGKESKLLYLLFFGLMLVAAYYVSDPYHIPSFIVQHSIIAQTVLICTSRFSQILQVYRLKSTGSLALLTFGLTVLGNFARITTIFFEASNDYKFLLSLVCVTLLNVFIVFQFWLYKGSKDVKDKFN